jgi:hypothetical protein
MTAALQRDLQPKGQRANAALAAGMLWGLMGGFAGTVVMDLVLIATLSAIGLPPVISFSTIGDTAAGVFAWLGLEVAGGFPLGATMHYLLGLVLGAVFGAVASQVKALRVSAPRRGVALAVVYIEIVSQPILALSPMVLPMTAAGTLQWFAISAAMHAIWGAVLGLAVSRGLRPATGTRQG